MLHKIKLTAKSLLKYFPYFEQIQKKRTIQSRYKTELELINGTHRNTNKHPSIIHFSFNKAASQYVKSILKRCASENGMVPVELNEYAFNTDFPFLDHLSIEGMDKYKHIFKREGYIYSVFGGMIEGIPDLSKYKIVFIVRDPRDILVSKYYSRAYSHKEPDRNGDKLDKFMTRRTRARVSTIDDFVILESERVYNSFLRYQDLLLDKYSNVYLTTYEKMTFEFDMWLNDLAEYCEFEVSEKLIKSLIEENEKTKPKEENIYKHIRKGKPGDYKEKLQPDTISYLNQKFAPILTRYNYN